MGSWVLESRTEGALKGFGVRDLNFCSSNYYLCESGQVIQLQGWDDKTRNVSQTGSEDAFFGG